MRKIRKDDKRIRRLAGAHSEVKAKLPKSRDISQAAVTSRELTEDTASTRILKLRNARGEKQGKFAKALGVSQATVSCWESGKEQPSRASCLLLGLFASQAGAALRPERDWFWQRAGDYMNSMAAAGVAILRERNAPPLEGEIFRVPCKRKTAQATEDAGRLLPLPTESVPNPSSTICLIVDETAANLMFHAGDLIVVDTSQNNAKDLCPFWDEIVLLEIDVRSERRVDPHFTWGMWPAGLSMGWLQYRQLRRSPPRLPLTIRFVQRSSWVAILSPSDDLEAEWDPRDEGTYVGHWEPFPVGTPGSIEELEAFEAEARKQAPSKIRLEDPCRILGRVIGWFPRQRK
jgi:DNA-binding transcriptional regulator YiaG